MISRPFARLEVSAAHATVDSNLLLCRITFEKTAYSCNLSHFFWVSISLLSVLYLLQYRLDKSLYLSIFVGLLAGPILVSVLLETPLNALALVNLICAPGPVSTPATSETTWNLSNCFLSALLEDEVDALSEILSTFTQRFVSGELSLQMVFWSKLSFRVEPDFKSSGGSIYAPW